MKEVVVFVACIIGVFALIFAIVIPLLWYTSSKKAEVLRAHTGLEITTSDVFWGGDSLILHLEEGTKE